MRQCLVHAWYARRPGLLAWSLSPLAGLFALLAGVRRLAYRRGWRRVERLPVPVIVVGNITVGGSGKTPLTIALVDLLRAAGWRPGVVSRGYGGDLAGPAPVLPDSDAARVGDEPVLIARRAACPVWIGRRRAEAGRALLARHPDVDVLVADDGLQHYALARDVEIAVLDAERGVGNGWRLPAGPLREPVGRLWEVDAVVGNGGAVCLPGLRTYPMRLAATEFWNLRDPLRRVPAAHFHGRAVAAVAGIGHPARFFSTLAALGIQASPHPFPDHHRYRPGDLPEGTVLMTEKDAAKCRAWASGDCWALGVDAILDNEFTALLIAKLKATHGPQTA